MHARIQEFSSGGGGGGGGGQGQSNKKSSDVFFSPQLILQKSNGQFQRNLSLSRFQRGSNTFQGVQLFPEGGGSNCLFPIEIRIACDFPGGGGRDPLSPPPLDPHLACNSYVLQKHMGRVVL